MKKTSPLLPLNLHTYIYIHIYIYVCIIWKQWWWCVGVSTQIIPWKMGFLQCKRRKKWQLTWEDDNRDLFFWIYFQSVCIYVYMYMCICVYVYLCIYVNMYICIYVYTYTCIYVYIYVCMYIYMHICVYVYMYMCIYLGFVMYHRFSLWFYLWFLYCISRSPWFFRCSEILIYDHIPSSNFLKITIL